MTQWSGFLHGCAGSTEPARRRPSEDIVLVDAWLRQ